MTKFLIATGASWLVGLIVFLIAVHQKEGWAGSTAIAYAATIVTTAVFHIRYVRTQREFLARQTPWLDFTVISGAEWITAVLAAWWVSHRLIAPGILETFIIAFGSGTLMRYILRKEFLQDIRGLRRGLARESEAPR